MATGPADGVGEPGGYPFTRGLFGAGYRTKLWTMRQYAGYGTADETNERFKYLLSQGQTGLSTAFDLPTQMGYDVEEPITEGEVGKVGVHIGSLRDFETLFDGIPLDKISTSMTINATAATLYAMYLAVGRKQGVADDRVSGTTQNDILKEYVARGTYIYPPRQGLRLATDLIAFAAKTTPRFNAVSVSGYHVRDAGCSAAQEMAFAMSFAVAYIEDVLKKGLTIDEFAPRISWIFNTHNDFFEEIAKYRALRRMWATMLKERYGATNPKSMMLRTHTQTGGSTLTRQQAEVNIVRAAYQGLAAVLGGVQSLALSCYDEAHALPTEFAQELALRTQQIIAHETGVTNVTDPLGGSWYIEKLTDELEARANEILGVIESEGGAVDAIESGRMQAMVGDAAYQYQREIEEGRRVIVGVNAFEQTVKKDADKIRPFDVDTNKVRAEQMKRNAEVRKNRDNAGVEATLSRLKDAARDESVNLLGPILEAVEAYATTGEIATGLKEVFGAYGDVMSEI
ncbi:MAG: methylmalonyl-CoA mutase family protein [Deltaproteobacteria bacterium]|nr:methylmalonyl-CoA mutase family protein [Deltaproteobacteria bacterium]